MKKLWSILKENKVFLVLFTILIIIFILTQIGTIYYFSYEKQPNLEENSNPLLKEEEPDKITIEIKGQIKAPGVYETSKNQRVNDIITLAGGLTNNASTVNLNLSKKLEDEMVIIVYSKDEINNYLKKKEEEQLLNEMCLNNSYDKNNNACLEKTNNTSLISINNASKDELMNLPGIGESKATSIIDYRQKTPFKTIEDIKNVAGIGEALYAQIKDFITT